jgi:hypothetical protein
VTAIRTDSEGHTLIVFSQKISSGTCGGIRPGWTDAFAIDVNTQEGKAFLGAATNAMRFASSATAHGAGTCTSYANSQAENLAQFHVNQ